MSCVRSRLRDERGFNLIEMMFALLIVGVLVSIAMPIFLGAVERADDAAARASLHTAQVAGRVFANEAPGYEDVTIAALAEIEPAVRWVGRDDPSLGPTIVSQGDAGGMLLLAAYSPTGTCFFLRDDPIGEVGRASVPGAERADCTASHAITVTFGPTW